MKINPGSPRGASELRRHAEARLRKLLRHQVTRAGEQRGNADTRNLLHELQVHQVELEMQNAELEAARDAAEGALEKYTDLYDFAPVGYFSLDSESRILEVNLTGAAQLGKERSRLLGVCLLRYVAPISRSTFLSFLKHVLAESGKQACEVAFVNETGVAFWLDLQADSIPSLNPRVACRLAASDVTARKRAEESQRRTEALTIANQELAREIVQRKAVEAALKLSQQQQSKLLMQSHHLQDELRHLSRQIIQAQEEERKRISRELHDDIAQTLVGINVSLAALAREAQINPQNLRSRITRTQRLVEKSVNSVHQFARRLRPSLLDDLGLIVTVHSLMKEFTKRTGIRVRFSAFAGVEVLDSLKRTVLYRVIQSALTNVAQHAQASRVNVIIQKHAKDVYLEITDNGKSFKVDQVLQAEGSHHLGLLGMRERVEMVGGSFSVTSAPGQGTTIRSLIPFVKRLAPKTSPPSSMG